MSAQSDLHNLLAGRFVSEIIGPAIKAGSSDAQITVIFESVQVAMLEILHRHYGLSPQVATSFCEESLYRAIERFAGSRSAVA